MAVDPEVQRAYSAIQAHFIEHGYAPHYTELARILGHEADVARVLAGLDHRIDGAESVELAVYKEGGTNTVTVSNAVTARLGSLRDELNRLDPNLKMEVITDQARYIRQAVREVLETALYGGLLAILVLYLFLRNRSSTTVPDPGTADRRPAGDPVSRCARSSLAIVRPQWGQHCPRGRDFSSRMIVSTGEACISCSSMLRIGAWRSGWQVLSNAQ